MIGKTLKRFLKASVKKQVAKILNSMPEFKGMADQITSQMMTYNRQ